MYNSPKVSIIIPCYNDKDYIQDAVQSAINQTYSNTEIIIVDDGSNDATKKVLSSIKCENVELITQENKGLSAARNVGITKATGEYILTLDADDIFEPTFVEKAVKILDDNQSVGLVCCFVRTFIEYGKSLFEYKPQGGEIDSFMYKNNAVGNSLYRRKCWEETDGYDENMRYGYEDWEFHVAITKRGWKVHVLKEYLFNYRDKPNSMLKTTNKNHEESNVKYVFSKHKELYIEQFDETIDYLLGIALRHKKNEMKRINSIEFKIGFLFMKPFRFMKKALNNVINSFNSKYFF